MVDVVSVPGGTPLQPQDFYVQTYVLIPNANLTLRAPVFNRLASALPKATGEALGTPAPLLPVVAAQRPFHQDLWDSAAKLPKAIGEAAAGVAPLLTPNPLIPFNQDLWESAALPKPKAAGEPLGTLNALLTPNPPQPFNQDLWEGERPLPKAIGEAIGGAAPLLTPNPPAPFNQDLWEGAARAWPKVTGEVTGTLSPLLTPTPPFNQDLWENPARVRLTATGEINNSIFVVTAPFVYDDWTRILTTQKVRVDDFVNLVPLYSVVVAVTPPFYQNLWDNAARVPLKAVGEAISGNAPLLTPNPPQPFVQSLWDSAVRAFPKAGGEVTGTLSPILTPNPPRPFAQRIWDLATPPKPKAYADPFAAIPALYNPNPSRPFSQYQWDSATRAWPKSVGESGGGILALIAPNPANPFNQSDWTRILTTSKAKVDDFVNLTPLYTFVVVPRQFHQDDWPSPARTPVSLKSDVYRGSNALLSPNPAQPFNQNLWDLPTQLPRLKSVGDVLASPNPIIYPNPPRPFAQSSWDSAARSFGPLTIKSDIYVNLLPLQSVAPPPTPIPAQYFLLQPHYVKDAYLQAWTIVTEGVEIPFGWIPTLMVDPLNQQAVNAFYAAGPRTGYQGPGYDWQGWQYLTAQREAVIQTPATFWKQTSPGMFALTGLGTGLPPVGGS